jgi:hypothetical protein
MAKLIFLDPAMFRNKNHQPDFYQYLVCYEKIKNLRPVCNEGAKPVTLITIILALTL